MLSLQEMKAIISRGESVLYKGTVISSENLEELPTEAELAIYYGSPEKIAVTQQALETELARIQQQISLLNISNPEAVASNASDADSRKGRTKSS